MKRRKLTRLIPASHRRRPTWPNGTLDDDAAGANEQDGIVRMHCARHNTARSSARTRKARRRPCAPRPARHRRRRPHALRPRVPPRSATDQRRGWHRGAPEDATVTRWPAFRNSPRRLASFFHYGDTLSSRNKTARNKHHVSSWRSALSSAEHATTPSDPRRWPEMPGGQEKDAKPALCAAAHGRSPSRVTPPASTQLPVSRLGQTCRQHKILVAVRGRPNAHRRRVWAEWYNE